MGSAPEPKHRSGQGYMENQQLPMHQVFLSHATDVVSGKRKDQHSLAPVLPQELPVQS